jgi:hypothetical protein
MLQFPNKLPMMALQFGESMLDVQLPDLILNFAQLPVQNPINHLNFLKSICPDPLFVPNFIPKLIDPTFSPKKKYS